MEQGAWKTATTLAMTEGLEAHRRTQLRINFLLTNLSLTLLKIALLFILVLLSTFLWLRCRLQHRAAPA